MPNQVVLEWEVDVSKSTFGPTEAQAALAAVDLYSDPVTDPVLGQFFGLVVADDDTVTTPTGAARTLTLNMTPAAGQAPPPFPCHPRTATPPGLPYPLLKTVSLAGSFFVTNGLLTVPTTATQVPALNIGDQIQFLSQQGVFYQVAGVTATQVNLTAAYTGTSTNTRAFKEVSDPATKVAVYSTSEDDTNGVATEPAIAAGSGARTVTLFYFDSTGAGPFNVTVSLTGKRPAEFTLDPASVDVDIVANLIVATVGGFGNSVGQLTLVGLSSDVPAVPAGTPLGSGAGAIEGSAPAINLDNTYRDLTDQAQALINRSLVYLPPSYFALAAQGATLPQLEGDFLVTTGSTNVPTVEDQTGVLAAGNTLRFASQFGTLYTVAAVTAKVVTLTEVYSGLDRRRYNDELRKIEGAAVINQLTGAYRISPSMAAQPSNAALSAPLGQFSEPQVAGPPPNPPLSPATVPTPTFLSDLFTQTIQLKLKGVKVTPATIGFL
jgi:hypothetical protein